MATLCGLQQAIGGNLQQAISGNLQQAMLQAQEQMYKTVWPMMTNDLDLKPGKIIKVNPPPRRGMYMHLSKFHAELRADIENWLD